MNALRWILGAIAILCGGGLVLLTVIGNGFRRSFGASEQNLWWTVLPSLGFLLLVAALVFPGSKPLLHAAALAAGVLMALCIWQLTVETAFPLWCGVVYLALWLVYYGMALHR